MVRLTMKEKRKLEVVQMVMDGRLKVSEAGKVLGRTVRTIYRLLARVRKRGVEGVIHGNRGNNHAKRFEEAIRDRVIELAKGKYNDVNDTHMNELLAKNEGIEVSREWLRRALRAAWLKPKRKRRRPKYRSRRERKEAFGMMLQIDASDHDWLEGRGPEVVVVAAIDDATGYVWARFAESESTWAYLELMRDVVAGLGLPLSLYSDRHTIFHTSREPTIIEQLNNIRPLTQFGRAMEDLGIHIIKAYSPQAKGRIEKLFNTLQDRLVVELRLAGVKTLEHANLALKQFLTDYNRRFTVAPRRRENLFRKAPSPSQLDRILCLKETRTVNKDHTISFEGLILQIPPSKKFRSLAGLKVDVLQLRTGDVEIAYKQQTVACFSPQAISRLITKIDLNKNQLCQLKDAA